MKDYKAFIESKTHTGADSGFAPLWIPKQAYDFQAFLLDWNIRKGRGALLADCGMGKTLMQLAWAENVVRHTNKPVLVTTPLAVAAQSVMEAEKFGIQATRSDGGSFSRAEVVVTNYEKLHKFNASDFGGMVCDESSILKSFDGARRGEITDFMRHLPYRQLSTATAAPNDYIELGTSSEALGYLGHMDMLNRFFKNDNNNSATGRQYGEVVKWRFKGHAEGQFWRWVCSWARAIRKPSDFGFEDGEFILPTLTETVHTVEARTVRPGMLFEMPAVDIREQREERRRTISERCDKVASLIRPGNQTLIWCHLNEEGDRLAKIPGAVQVSGKDRDEAKEEKFLAFANGQIQTLVTKPKIGAWGLNFQNCNHVISFPSHSFEQHYQAVRRCWRFGQKRPVQSDIVTTHGELAVIENQQRKARQAEYQFTQLIENMNAALSINGSRTFDKKETLPSWLAKTN